MPNYLQSEPKSDFIFQDVHSSVITTFKDDHVIPLPPTHGLLACKKVNQNSTECSKNTTLKNSELSEVLPSDRVLSTPSQKDSVSKTKATNSRTRKRDAFGQRKEDLASPINSITRFTVGKSDAAKPSNVKRKLMMNQDKCVPKTNEKSLSPEKKLVTFQKAGNLSPVKIPACFSVDANGKKAGQLSSTEVSFQ